MCVTVRTWRVDQSHVVSFLQAPPLHQQGRHSLCPLVELQAGEGARHRPLEGEDEGESEKKNTTKKTVKTLTDRLAESSGGRQCRYPGAEQRVQDVVRRGLSSPL